MKNERPSARIPLAALTALLLPLAGCGDGGGDLTGPGSGGDGGQATVSLSVTSGPAASAARSPGFALEQTDDTGNSLVIDSVQVVLREIELERQNDECPDDSSGSSDENDACEKFVAGIRLLRVPLDGSVDRMIAIQAPADTYDEVEFEIHKPDDDDPEGREFIRQNPNFEDVSVRMKGSFNGESFLFLQDLNEDQERVLNPPLVLEEAGEVNLTLRLDVSAWFVRNDGTLVDPRTANKGGANENLVEENIENSIEVFEDDDEDGEDDG